MEQKFKNSCQKFKERLLRLNSQGRRTKRLGDEVEENVVGYGKAQRLTIVVPTDHNNNTTTHNNHTTNTTHNNNKNTHHAIKNNNNNIKHLHINNSIKNIPIHANTHTNKNLYMLPHHNDNNNNNIHILDNTHTNHHTSNKNLHNPIHHNHNNNNNMHIHNNTHPHHNINSSDHANPSSSHSSDGETSPLFSYPPGRGGHTVYQGDLQLLHGTSFINDTIINVGLAWANQAILGKALADAARMVDALLFSQLTRDTQKLEVDVAHLQSNMKRLSKWFPEGHPFDKPMCVIPACYANHWVCIVIKDAGEELLIGSMDSLGSNLGAKARIVVEATLSICLPGRTYRVLI